MWSICVCYIESRIFTYKCCHINAIFCLLDIIDVCAEDAAETWKGSCPFCQSRLCQTGKFRSEPISIFKKILIGLFVSGDLHTIY